MAGAKKCQNIFCFTPFSSSFFTFVCFPQFYLCFHVQLEMHSKTRSHHSIVAKKKRKQKNRNIVENENKEK